MNELLESVKKLYKKYEGDNVGLTRLRTYVLNDINDMMEMYEEEKKEKKEIEDKIVDYISTFFYKNENKYYSCLVRENEKIHIKYDGLDFEICNSDIIWHEIITDLNPHKFPKLSKFKHDITERALHNVLENDVFNCIPESTTIQKIIEFMCPLFFKTKEEVKYFLAAIGDRVNMRNSDLLYYVPEISREFLTELNVYYSDYFGVELMKQFKFKYRGFPYNKSRLIKFKRSIKNVSYWNNFVKNNFFNILIVSVHYSSRYGGSQKYVEKQSTELQKKILYLKDKTSEDIIAEFQKEFLKDSSDSHLTQDEMYFLWKIFCENKNMPLIIYKQDFFTKIGDFKNMTSDYLIGIRHFRSFWDETITTNTQGEYEISEINELFTIWLNGNKENTVNEYQLLDIIKHFFPQIQVGGKNLLNITCSLWDKHQDIQKCIVNNKDRLKEKDHNLLEIYKLYCSYAAWNDFTNIVSKKYFEKYMDKMISKDFLKNNKVLKDFWLN
jgi:hypothetical protein